MNFLFRGYVFELSFNFLDSLEGIFPVPSGIKMSLCLDILSVSQGKWISPENILSSILFFLSTRTNPPTRILIFKVSSVSTPIILLLQTIINEDPGKTCTSSRMKIIDLVSFGILDSILLFLDIQSNPLF